MRNLYWRNLFTELWRGLTNRRLWAYFLFWSWNGIFLAFVLLGFAPNLLPEIIQAVRTENFPITFLVCALIITFIPVLAVIIGAVWLRSDPERLFGLGYVIEGPLMMLVIIRFFVIRELTAGLAFLLAIATLGMIAYLWQLLDRQLDDRGRLVTAVRVAGLTLLLAIGVYASLWLAFYAVPIGGIIGRMIVETLLAIPTWFADLWNNLDSLADGFDGIFMIPIFLLGSALLFYTATLFVVMPIAVPILSGRAWWRSMQALAHQSRMGWLQAGAISALVLAVCAALFSVTNRQPQKLAFDLLAKPPASPIEASYLLAQQETIRVGLLNAYLSQQRYISAKGEVGHVGDLYRDAFGDSFANSNRIEKLYEVVARPLLYEPVHAKESAAGESARRFNDNGFMINQRMEEESQEAADLYRKFFDQPITKGEQEAIVASVRSTWSPEQSQIAWQAVDDREVYLTQQEVTVAEHGDWAEIELHEVYANRTFERQEVVYYFSLPESAVVTGVWLGNSEDRSQRFPYTVAPRGAAQAVYREQVRRQMDPALVEQIGPRQYRLRVFPIEPKLNNWSNARGRSIVEEGIPMHLWLTVRVLAQDTAWPLPQLAELRNVYWDDQTVRTLNGQVMTLGNDLWLPTTAAIQTPSRPTAHRIDFPTGESVIAQPVTEEEIDLTLPAMLRLAVVLDRSRSMAHRSADVQAALSQLDTVAGSVEVYLTASALRGEAASRAPLAQVDPANLLYFGGQNAGELLVQFGQLRNDDTYDAILVLTDDAGFELGEAEQKPAALTAPVWMVHLGGKFPLGYDDPTLDAINASGGGITGSLDEALARLAVALAAQKESTTASDIIDGYVWHTLPTSEAAQRFDLPSRQDDPFAALAARRLMLTAMQRQRGNLGEISTLDQLHAIAVEASIVTPLSSMIVLVNDQQRELLKKLSGEADRFAREVEAEGETQFQNALNGVPEPEEWLLLMLVVGLLGWYWRTQRRDKTLQRTRESNGLLAR